MHRKVENVVWARMCARPTCIPQARRLRGTKAKGLAYERSLAKALHAALPSAVYGQWFSYEADGEHGYCQTDFLWHANGQVYLIECKLTNVEQATEQMLDLYLPVLHCAFKTRVRGIIVVRSVHRVPALATIVRTLNEAIELTKEKVPVLHWIGHGPL